METTGLKGHDDGLDGQQWRLTAVEEDALRMVSEGLSHGQIAIRLNVGEAEVGRTVARCLVKLRERPTRERLSTEELSEQRRLTDRQREVLRLSTTLTAAKVAERLGMSEKTVKNHMANIYAKLGATNKTEALLRAVRTGQLSRGEVGI